MSIREHEAALTLDRVREVHEARADDIRHPNEKLFAVIVLKQTSIPRFRMGTGEIMSFTPPLFEKMRKQQDSDAPVIICRRPIMQQGTKIIIVALLP